MGPAPSQLSYLFPRSIASDLFLAGADRRHDWLAIESDLNAAVGIPPSQSREVFRSLWNPTGQGKLGPRYRGKQSLLLQKLTPVTHDLLYPFRAQPNRAITASVLVNSVSLQRLMVELNSQSRYLRYPRTAFADLQSILNQVVLAHQLTEYVTAQNAVSCGCTRM